MRTNIEIGGELLAETMAAARLDTKKAMVEEALRVLARNHRERAAIADMSGVGWQGDLAALRQGRLTKSRR